MAVDIEGTLKDLVNRVVPEEQRAQYLKDYGFGNTIDLSANATTVREQVAEVDDVETLNALQVEEEEGKDRSTVLAAIAERRAELEDAE